jgi:ABC-type branched-subunit amino acid transport system substrate-binding protein
VGASDNQLGSKMAAYAAKELKVKRVVIVDDRSAYGQGVAEEFAREAKAQKIEIVAREFTNDKANDFSAILTSARAAKPDAVFLGGYTPQAGPMLRQMQSLGLKAKLLGGDGVCSSETAKLAGSNAAAENNVWCTQGGAMLDRASKGQAFITKYKTTYKRDPLTYAVAFYDAAFVLANAMSKAQSLEPAKVGAAMAAGSHAGVAGTYAFDAKHDLKSSPVTVFTFKDGQPSPVTTY